MRDHTSKQGASDWPKAGNDIFFLVSSDGNHYGKDFNNSSFGKGEKAWESALALDRRLIDSYLTGGPDAAKIEGLTKELWGATYTDYRNTYWCGKYSVPFGLLAAGSKTTQLIVAADTEIKGAKLENDVRSSQ